MLTHSGRGEYVKLNFRPQVHSDARFFVHVPVVLPQLHAKIYKVNHRTIAPLAFFASKIKLLLQRTLDKLRNVSNVQPWRGERKTMTPIRNLRLRYTALLFFFYLPITSPLPAGGKVFVGLNNGAQASPRVIVSALDPEGNTPHEIFRRCNAVRSYARMFN
jgi:hypothetical protein